MFTELEVEIHLFKEGAGPVARFQVVGRVHARHQGANGEELYRHLSEKTKGNASR